MTKQTAAKHLGNAGEAFVSNLLEANGWQILAIRWRCRWGELDVIARDRTWLIFVEVKTRSRGNWDLNGMLAITPQKQRKLWRSAREFLAHHTYLATLACRFDVALVLNQASDDSNCFQLEDYIESAFSEGSN